MLKATAPVPASPMSGATLTTTTPTLTVENAHGLYLNVEFVYHFEVYDADRGTLATSGLVGQGTGTSAFQVTTQLDYGVTYWWRTRAQRDGASGPWSPTFGFVTPSPPTPATTPLSFTDISVSSGIAPSAQGGHGVMFGDATGNGSPDLYITMNFDDPQADLFFINNGISFAETGNVRGVADFDVGSHGAAFAGPL